MAKKPKTNGTLLILTAGIFWGSMGIFVRGLTALAGFTSIQIVTIRLTVAALSFALILFFKNKKGFLITPKDIPLFLGLGLGSILFFSTCYFTAISMMTLSVAAILLYTSPIWVMLLSILLFHEKMTRTKLFALAVSFLGCILVSGIGTGETSVTITGILIGLGSVWPLNVSAKIGRAHV